MACSTHSLSVIYTGETISFIYTSPGDAHRPENALLTYIAPSDDCMFQFNLDPNTYPAEDYWIGVNWQAGAEGACDPDMQFQGTVLQFKDGIEKVVMYHQS